MKDGNSGSYFLKSTSLRFNSTQGGVGDLSCALGRGADNPGGYYTAEKW